MMKYPFLLALLVACFFTQTVDAHGTWLDRSDEGQIRLYFGEYPDGHASAERLQSFVNAKGVLMTNGQTTPAKGIIADGYIAFGHAESASISLEDRPVMDMTKHGKGMTRLMIYARYGLSDTSPRTVLDAVPVKPGSKRVRVIWRDQPLSKASVTLTFENGWELPLRTDQKGEVELPTPWPGAYLLQVKHAIEVDGTFDGKAYQRLSNHFKLKFNHRP
jgi:hypothetical protein